jgi:hypothetical protein
VGGDRRGGEGDALEYDEEGERPGDIRGIGMETSSKIMSVQGLRFCWGVATLLLVLFKTDIGAEGTRKEVSKGFDSAFGVPVFRNFRLASNGL